MIYFLKDCLKKVFKIYKEIVIENFKPLPLCPIKWGPFNAFAKLYKGHLLIANRVKGAVSSLRQLLAKNDGKTTKQQ